MTVTQKTEDSAPRWEGVPEVICTGTPYEIGFAHGSQIPQRIATCISNYAILFLETAEADWDESRRRAKVFLEPLERNAPDMVEEMQGIADGAKIDFIDILTLNLRSEIALTNYSDGCTSIATSDSSASNVLIAQNWDWVGEASNSTAFFDIQRTGYPRIRMFGEAGLVGKFGLNEAGVGVCMNAIRCGNVNTEYLPVHIAIRKVLECQSFEEAEKMLTTRGVASCVNFVVADREGNLATIECSPKGNVSIRPTAGSQTVCHTNHLYAQEKVKDHPSQNSFSRLDRIRELSQEGQASSKKIRAWLSDEKGTPVSICRSIPPNTKGVERMETLATIIMDLSKLEAEVSLGKPSLSPPIRKLAFI